MERIFLLRCAVKNYDWGKFGSDSKVAQLSHAAYEDFEVQKNVSYSELWMGTHPSGPSLIPSLNTGLSDFLKQHPDLLGTNISRNFKTSGLPFLFKVLSIRKSLSIQVHPDKKTAEKLHKEFSDRYPDDNHKPELAIALTEFKALCGFRPVAEIKSFITSLPQLKKAIGIGNAKSFLNAQNDGEDVEFLKSGFTALMTQKEEVFQPLLADLILFFSKDSSLSDLCESVKDLFLKLHNDYPNDIGCFCVFFLNYLVLQPGEAIFFEANKPHAYLYGDCVECMATSDNVVRAGLTPKFRDVDTLCEILSYKCSSTAEILFHPHQDNEDTCALVYNPPVPDFAVDKLDISAIDSPYTIKLLNSASLVLIINGEADIIVPEAIEKKLSTGKVLFVSSNTEVKLKVTSKNILMFRAYCSV